MNGILIIDKPMDFTSFDVVAVVRKYTHQKKIGHTGTLDPNATGVLVMLLGNATKAQDLIINHDKEYIAQFKLGVKSDTLDIWGNVETVKKPNVSQADIEKLLPNFTGEISQIPPMFSAVQQNGQRLYDLARKGIEVKRKSRNCTIYNLVLSDFDGEVGTLKISCSKGTYIRTLIDDIGKKLGCGAVMTALKRVNACGYSIDKAISLDAVKSFSENDSIEEKLMSTESLFTCYKEITVSDLQANRFKNGGELDLVRTALKNGCNDGEIYRVKDNSKNFLGLGKVDFEKQQLVIFKLF